MRRLKVEWDSTYLNIYAIEPLALPSFVRKMKSKLSEASKRVLADNTPSFCTAGS